MDRLEKAISPSTRIRFTFVEAMVASKALEARHLCGPTAGMALAEGVVAVALLSADAGSVEEAVMLRVNASGPIGGVLVEAAGDGGLRGFSNIKVLNDLDERTPIDTAEAWGKSGSVQIVTSTPGKIVNQAVLNVNPPLMRYVLARYFNHSMQVPTACAIRVVSGSGGLVSARGLLAQRMVDSDTEAFVRVLECFEGNQVAERLAAKPVATDVGASSFGDVFDLSDMVVRETRELMFKCRCSRARTLAVLDTLSKEELEQMIEQQTEQDITCHMCGRVYTAAVADIRSVLDQKR